jgi:DNA polymerase I-like protein with 3'-5' exonuclease and polymerase domains/uracil-DNA glycosylase
MAEYRSLLWPDAAPVQLTKNKSVPLRGCVYCSLNEVKGVQKIKGTVEGKHIMVWAQSPGPVENEEGRELVGPSGRWFWKRMAEAGLYRDDCDIQNVVRCVDGGTQVCMADGSYRRINELVKKRVQDCVLAVTKDGCIEPRKIVGWYRSPRKERAMLRISWQGARKLSHAGIRGTNLSADHLVLTRFGYKQAGELSDGDEIASGEPGITSRLCEYITGGLLGDGSLSCHGRPFFYSQNCNLGWISAQRRFLQSLFVRCGQTKGGFESRIGAQVNWKKRYRVHTASLAALSEFRKKWYPEGRKVVPSDIQLTPLTLAVWFMDDGWAFRKRGRIAGGFATQGFKSEDVLRLAAILMRMGIECTVPKKSLVRYPRIYITVGGMPVLYRMIAKYIVPSMRYKIIDSDVPSYDERLWTAGPAVCHYAKAVISEATCKKRSGALPDTLYCIDIERDHNFITRGGVIHNCFPATREDGKLVMRNPSPEEVACCSLYTDRALIKSRARVHIVLGQVAARELFGAKFKKERMFWSDKMNGHVVILDHPSFFIRGFGSGQRLQWFKQGLQAAARFAKEKYGKFSYLAAQDYKAAISEARALRYADEIRAWAKQGFRVVVDMETGKPDPDGPKRALCIGFSGRAGSARVFLLRHETGVDVPRSVRRAIQGIVIDLLEDESIKKVCHHGSFDVTEARELLKAEMCGYDYDTNYAEYFRYPGRRSYALAEIVAVRFPDFTGFKEVIMPEAAPERMTYDQAMRKGKLDFAKVPWDKLVLRCAADCDLTKRIEVTTKKHISLSLLHVYMDSAFTLERMEKNGPWFDYKQCELLGEIYPTRLKWQTEELQVMAGDPNFNPGSPIQVANVIYRKLKLPQVSKGLDTQRATLDVLATHHEFPAKIIKFRVDDKLESTYRAAFKACADAHGGRLFTKFWQCLAEGQLVLTNRGYIPVENVQVNDLVLTHCGREKRVTSVFANGRHRIVKVTLGNGLVLEATGNHPYRIEDGWMAANELSVGMRVMVHSGPEKWKVVEGWPNYYVSSWGRVCSNKGKRRMLQPFGKGRWGHLQVALCQSGEVRHFPIHRLVAAAFLPPSVKPETRHLNGIPWDNTVQNLRWGTRLENAYDSMKHGTARKTAAITNSMIDCIRSFSRVRGSDARFARDFGVSIHTVRDIRSGKFHRVKCEGKAAVFYKVPVAKIEYLPSKMTYGLTVENDGSHVTMGIVTHNTGTKTGRLSSGGSREGEEFLTVNLQNIVGDPQVENMLVSDKRWRDIAAAWKDKTRDDWYERFLHYRVYVKYDYAQNELRFLAQSSGDPELIKDFKSGVDIHCAVGNRMTGWPVDVIAKDREKRTLIKGFHFGMVYGLTVDGMLGHLKRAGVTVPCKSGEDEREAVERMMKNYFNRYNRVLAFIRARRKQAEEKGYVENLLGFRCPIDVSGESKGGYWENLAVNAPIQGGAHQILTIGLALLNRKPKHYSLIRTPESENHDALMIPIRLGDLLDAVKQLRQLAEHDVVDVLRDEFKIDWQIPLVADMKAGFRYGVMVEFKEGMTIADFMEEWCVENRKSERELWTEIRKIREANSVV